MTARRFVARWYPVLALVLFIPIGTTVGGIWGGGGPALGHAILPFVYPPMRFVEWVRADAPKGSPQDRASTAAFLTFIVVVFGTWFRMVMDRVHGRDWGWALNALLFVAMLDHDVRSTGEGLPSSFTFLGSGGIIDNEPQDRAPAARSPRSARSAAERASDASARRRPNAVAGRKLPFAGIWQLTRSVVAVCMLAFGINEISSAVEFHAPKTVSYAGFARSSPSRGWFTITGATLDYDRGIPRRTNRGNVGSYVPVVDPSGKILVVVASYDDVAKRGLVREDLHGTIATFFDKDSHLDGDMARYGGRLSPDYRLIMENQKPNVWLGLLFGLLGTLLGLALASEFIGWIGGLRRRRSLAPAGANG